MKVYIVRHGEVLHNVLKQYSVNDDDLTDIGIKQAEELQNKIKNIKFDIIICSPLLRAKHTADIININNNKIIYDDRLIERKCGNLDGKSYSDTDRNEIWNYNTNIKQGTIEDIKEFFNRVYDFLNEIKNKDYQSVLVVAHSGVSKAFKAYFEGIGDGYFLNKGLENCEIKEYEL